MTMTTGIPDCDREVHERGEMILMTHTVRPTQLEEWVTSVRVRSGQRVDWHYAGGRALVKYIGDEAKVREAIEVEAPRLIELFVAEYTKALGHEPPTHYQVAAGYGNVKDIFVGGSQRFND